MDTDWDAAQILRKVLDCGSPLPLFHFGTADPKAPEDWRTPRRWRALSAAFFHPCLSVPIRGWIHFFLALEQHLSIVV
jgi:hypothetical protein